MKTVFITGGARRIGRGLALGFAKKGWDVAFSYYSSGKKARITEKEIQKSLVSTYSFKADSRDYDDLSSGFEKMVKEFRIPDVIINNAAIFPKKSSLTDLSIEEWQNVLNSNLNSVFYASKLFSKYAKDNSAIINIGSIGAFEIWDGRIPYHVSKAGVIQLTKALARELAPKISVNCVSPGTVDIDGEPDENHVPRIESKNNPMRRNALIDDVFKACLFFAENRSFITGENLIVDGGYNLTR